MSLSSFPPVVAGDATVLILGSMPGKVSLERQQYYAHPRNAFWYIMGQLCGADVQLSYKDRKEQLCEAGIALWDVLARSVRPGNREHDLPIRREDLPADGRWVAFRTVTYQLGRRPVLHNVPCNRRFINGDGTSRYMG